MATVVVSGAIANKLLNGGGTWVRLSWVLGLQRLGCDVHFVEQIGRDTCVGDDGAPSEFEHSANLAYFERVARAFGIESRATLVYERGEQTSGRSLDELVEIARSADLLVNVS